MSIFHFKYFTINQSRSALKVGTDSMVLGTLISCDNKKKGLDIGSGTGVLSLMLAQKNSEIILDAIELDTESSLDCQLNFENSDWSNRLNLVVGDFLASNWDIKYDLIFTNPPFFENSQENEKDNKTMARHTKSLPFDLLFEKVAALLDENGSFWIILPFLGKNKQIRIAELAGLSVLEEWIIEGKPNQPIRSVMHFKKKNIENSEVQLILKSFLIRNTDGTYSENYKNATIDFHNKAV